MPSRRYARYWATTIPANQHWIQHLPDGITYLRGQLERGKETGYEHWQLYLECERARTRFWVQSRFPPNIHFEPTRSEAYIGYCGKEETAIRGTLFHLGRQLRKRNTKEEWDAYWTHAKTGAYEEIPASVRLRYWRNILSINSYYQKPEPIVKEVYIFTGETGLGKSKRAFWESSKCGETFYKNARNKWWDGYRCDEHFNVVFDDFDGKSIAIDHLLRWFDRYPVTGEIKGGTVPLLFTKCWVTSNIPFDEWFPDAPLAQRYALRRRVKVTNFLNEWNIPTE